MSIVHALSILLFAVLRWPLRLVLDADSFQEIPQLSFHVLPGSVQDTLRRSKTISHRRRTEVRYEKPST